MPGKTKKSTTEDLLTLSCFGKIGPRGFAKLEALQKSYTGKRTDFRLHGNDKLKVYDLSVKDLTAVGIRQEVAEELERFRNQFQVEVEMKRLEALGIRLVTRNDADYPPLLHEITDPPFLLFCLGDLGSLHRASLAVVGSRRHSHYAEGVIERLIPTLAQRVTIVSGLALGVDGLAHKSTLAAGGLTVAVLACGLDVIYPSEHRNLAQKILQSGGAIMSEYPLGTPPLRQHFPARNRIISGVSQGTLVIECDIKSGAMITAHHALDQNRDVYAVPGPITSAYSSGPNMLLRMGATVVTKVEDVLEAYGITKQDSAKDKRESPETLPPHELTIFNLLGSEPAHIDTLAEASTLEMAEINSALLFLEMKGMVRNVGAACYVRR